MGLTLDCGLPTEIYVPKPIGEFIAEVSAIRDIPERILKLDEYINRLQDEMKKIEAFKRELPLCMLLLSNAVAALEEELMKSKKSDTDPVLEEFIPLKKTCSDDVQKEDKAEDGEEKDLIRNREKMNWMSSVQLWNSDYQNHHQNTDNLSNVDSSKKRKEEPTKRQTMDDLFSIGKNRALGMAFSGLKGFTNFPAMTKEGRDEFAGVAVLRLRTPEIKNSKDEIYSSCFSSKSGSSRSGSSSATNDQSNLKSLQQQTVRKQRRCWSPELHRRFINALQHLGGAKAATPKQIRELMQVDGLTNDEVKSHLQKYRLHTRTVPPAPTAQPAVLGGLWKCGESSKASTSQSGSPQGPLHLAGSSRGTSTSMEDDDEEDDRSESQSWKSQSHSYL